MPQLHRLDGRAPARPRGSPATIAAMSSRRRAPAPNASEEDSLVACGPGVERIADEVAALLPEARDRDRHLATRSGRPPRPPSSSTRMEAGDIDIVDRHAARDQGLSFPQSDAGRRDRRRSRPGGRRSARGRAHLPADHAGRRPRRARRQAGPRLHPDARAQGAGDAGAGDGRCRRLLRRRDRGAARGRRAAVRPLRRDRRLERRTRPRRTRSRS